MDVCTGEGGGNLDATLSLENTNLAWVYFTAMSTHVIAPSTSDFMGAEICEEAQVAPLCSSVCLAALYLSGKSQVLLSKYPQRAKSLSLLAQMDSWGNISCVGGKSLPGLGGLGSSRDRASFQALGAAQMRTGNQPVSVEKEKFQQC